MSPSEAPESDEPYCATACFSSAISSALIDTVTRRECLSNVSTWASTLSPTLKRSGRCSDRSRCAAGDSDVEPWVVSHHVLLAHAAVGVLTGPANAALRTFGSPLLIEFAAGVALAVSVDRLRRIDPRRPFGQRAHDAELIGNLVQEAEATPDVFLRDLADQPFINYRPSEVPGLHALVVLACQNAGFMPRASRCTSINLPLLVTIFLTPSMDV